MLLLSSFVGSIGPEFNRVISSCASGSTVPSAHFVVTSGSGKVQVQAKHIREERLHVA
jgi:hypothetical protein